MRKSITILIFIALSCTLVAHEETYYAIEYSNLHLKVMVGYSSSYQDEIARAYAPLINDFIKEIDSSQKVFMQFDEDYCLFNITDYQLSYGLFKQAVSPQGFPFGYPYDMGFITVDSGLNIIITDRTFRIKPILQLIEYGLGNRESVMTDQKQTEIIVLPEYLLSPYVKDIRVTIDKRWIDYVLNQKRSTVVEKYCLKKVPLEITNNKNINIYLFNDSIWYKDIKSNNLIKTYNIQTLFTELKTESIFLFDTERTFYLMDLKNGVVTEKNKLPFSINDLCENRVFVDYLDSCYVISHSTTAKEKFCYIPKVKSEK